MVSDKFFVRSTTRCCHKLVASFHSFFEILCFIYSSNISASCHLNNFIKTYIYQCLRYFIYAERYLTDNRRSKHCNKFFAFLDFAQNIYNLAFFMYGTERACCNTSTASDTFRKIYLGMTMFIFMDSLCRTAVFAGNNNLCNGIVRTCLHTLHTSLTLITIYN